MDSNILVEVKNLTKHFPIQSGLWGKKIAQVHAADNISFHINYAETYALVGESGCGKSTTGRLILRLIEPTSGEIWLDGENITNLKKKQLLPLRKKMQIIFQDPFSSLNPRMTVDKIVQEGMTIYYPNLNKEQLYSKTLELLQAVGLGEQHMSRYPHEFSGGQRQRIGIARALAVQPKFIICDEAVSALDVSIQAQIINLLQELQSKYKFAYLFIAHDLAVVKHLAHRVGVMYLGQIVEEGPVEEVFSNPLHPYTAALLSAIPEPDPNLKKQRIILTGDVPRADQPPSGCRFHTRCQFAQETCKKQDIPEFYPSPNHRVKCLLFQKGTA